MIKKGEITINDILLGVTPISKLYLGNTEIWNNQPQPTLNYFNLEAPSGETITMTPYECFAYKGVGSKSSDLEYSTNGTSWTCFDNLAHYGQTTYTYSNEAIKNMFNECGETLVVQISETLYQQALNDGYHFYCTKVGTETIVRELTLCGSSATNSAKYLACDVGTALYESSANTIVYIGLGTDASTILASRSSRVRVSGYMIQFPKITAYTSSSITLNSTYDDYVTDFTGSWTATGYYYDTITANKIYIRGKNDAVVNTGRRSSPFKITGNINKISGDIRSLVNYENMSETEITSLCDIFYGLNVVDASGLSLPYNVLGEGCYSNMFYGCTNLTSAPELPATTLAEYCYRYMFSNCTSLTESPEIINPTTNANYCYQAMFYGCTSLNHVICNISSSNYHPNNFSNWLYNVAANGTFERIEENDVYTDGASGIPTGWTITPDIAPNYVTFECIAAGGISIDRYGGNTSVIEYNKNNTGWNTFSSNVNMVAGDILQLRGNNPSGIGSSSSNYIKFVTSSYSRFNLSGNVSSLLNNTGIYIERIPSDYCFYSLLRSTTVVDASDFIINTYYTNTQYTCYDMFRDCTSLTTAPALPATTLSSSCYYQMFKGCTSLVEAPELPATTLAEYCYRYMFSNCTNLTTAPALPATTLSSSCYQNMFCECSSLISAPELHATTLMTSCYCGMFEFCTSLTTAPELPATTLKNSCYYCMFHGCNSLSYIKCLATNISASYCTTSWTTNPSATGTFVKNAEMSSWTTGADGIPSGWTVQDA